MNYNFVKLLEFIRTVKSKNDFLYESENASELLYKQGTDIDTELKGNLSDIIYESYIDYKKTTGGDFLKFKDDLEYYLKGLPEIRIELSKSPSESSLIKISEWLRVNVAENILIEFVVNPVNAGSQREFYKIIEEEGKVPHLELVCTETAEQEAYGTITE